MNKVRSYLKTIKKICLFMVLFFMILLLVPIGLGTYFFCKADFKCPTDSIDLSSYKLTLQSDSLRIIQQDFVQLNQYGLWEARLSGTPIERGSKYGLLTKDLLHYQEKAFVSQIRELVPSDSYLSFLHKLVAVFNWNMASYIPEEYRKEIYAVSQSCSHEFDRFGTPYERQLNYHAAHDIGHTMQEYMLVGCSSFAAWGSCTADSSLIIGRNFDFYVGDSFARNKIILFMSPDKGYRYASVTWPGMMGVVSGMNECGLTVTINAAKGALPVTSAMPISLLVRKILQEASDIQSAFTIAQSHQTFISESILVGSAKDNRAAIIEKSPDQTALFTTNDGLTVCTNHFQSDDFADDAYNQDNIAHSDSPYRWKRLNQLVHSQLPLDYRKAAFILRDRKGIGNQDIGFTNQKSINQSIAHHSVIFQPHELKMWVSTSPWQSGPYICYDLNQVFTADVAGNQLYDSRWSIAADTAFVRHDYNRVVEFRRQSQLIRSSIRKGEELQEAFLQKYLQLNPCYFGTYDLVGDYYQSQGHTDRAVRYWKQALQLEIPTKAETEKIKNKVIHYD